MVVIVNLYLHVDVRTAFHGVLYCVRLSVYAHGDVQIDSGPSVNQSEIRRQNCRFYFPDFDNVIIDHPIIASFFEDGTVKESQQK